MLAARLEANGDRPAVEQLRAQNRAALASLKGGERYATTLPSVLVDDPSVLVGTIGDAVVGYAVMRYDDGTAVLDELYVEPEARHVGVGHRLIELAIATASARGCGWIESVALPGDRHTKNFFEAHGMVSRLLRVSRPLR